MKYCGIFLSLITSSGAAFSGEFTKTGDVNEPSNSLYTVHAWSAAKYDSMLDCFLESDQAQIEVLIAAKDECAFILHGEGWMWGKPCSFI